MDKPEENDDPSLGPEETRARGSHHHSDGTLRRESLPTNKEERHTQRQSCGKPFSVLAEPRRTTFSQSAKSCVCVLVSDERKFCLRWAE